MFTGIIEALGMVKKVTAAGTNKTFWVESPVSHELKIDQSVSHNGVCLTVESIAGNVHTVTAIEETLKKTNLGSLKEGETLNLERCMVLNGRLDGHIVQGHVDGTAECMTVTEKEGSWEYEFRFEEKFAPLVIEKGSACINGTSLTVFNVMRNSFKVAIIPYTYYHTNINRLAPGSIVNIEFDVIGKYILRNHEINAPN